MTDAETLLRMPARGDAIAALCRRSHVRRLDLFGSAATGDGFDPVRSDFDLLVAFRSIAAGGVCRRLFRVA